MKRRDFIKAGSLGLIGTVAGTTTLLTWSQRAYSATINVNLSMVAGDVTMIDDTLAYMFTFSTTGLAEYPGPTILCQEGDTIQLSLNNNLSTQSSFKVQGTSIYKTVAANSNTSLIFTAPVAGTYLYHDSLNNGVNRVMGLHGALVVMPRGITNKSFATGPSFIRQYKWILGNVDPLWGEAVRTNGHNYVTNAALSLNSFKPRYFTINGQSYNRSKNSNTSLEGLFGEPALVRMLNAGMATHSPHFHGNHVKVISINQKNFTPELIKSKDAVSMFPLDARDVIYPFETPPDAWPPVTGPQHYPMHCHAEPSQTAAGGMYPHGMHTVIDLGHTPSAEPKL